MGECVVTLKSLVGAFNTGCFPRNLSSYDFACSSHRVTINSYGMVNHSMRPALSRTMAASSAQHRVCRTTAFFVLRSQPYLDQFHRKYLSGNGVLRAAASVLMQRGSSSLSISRQALSLVLKPTSASTLLSIYWEASSRGPSGHMRGIMVVLLPNLNNSIHGDLFFFIRFFLAYREKVRNHAQTTLPEKSRSPRGATDSDLRKPRIQRLAM